MRSRCQFFIILVLLSSSFQPLFAQLGFDLEIDKPEPYDNRALRAEKTGDKALKGSRKFFQNLTTHYNYYFNASNKLNEVIDGAKQSFRDDYTDLLPFYNYTLDATAQNATQLDSVIYKSQTGLVMHDLRNDWADNMYLLWGAAWFLEKKFDSAALMFQFINYAFAEKEKDGYYKYIGSRLDGNNALSIATDEKKKTTSAYGSRNKAFIWQIRTFIESGRLTEAGTLITTLKNDPLFPKRLDADLEEVQAYWYYKQKIWDSSAVHLVEALNNAKTKQERARWEYLAAQMFEKAKNFDAAKEYYSKAIGHTTDPVMDVYSRLNVVRVTKDSSENYIDYNVAELLKMARRDKYTDYRDVIYYMAAQMELGRNNLEAAENLLLQASKYNNGNLSSRSKSFLMIADLAYDQKKYLQAAAFYDSVNSRDIQGEDLERIQERKSTLAEIVRNTSVISRQDSLQRIAAMPEEERTAYINKLVKRMLKERGLSDVTITSGNLLPNQNADLFPSAQSKGEWYFYNSTLKTQGAAQFRQVWGNRPNVDNWRRYAVVSQQLSAKIPNNPTGNNRDIPVDPNLAFDNTPSFTNLISNVPLTEEQLKKSNDSVSNALFHLGNVLLNEVEDYLSAIDAYEKLLSHYPSYPNKSEVLFNLYYAYKKSGNQAEADRIKKLLLAQYPTSRFAGIITTGKDPAADNKSEEVTKAYEDIYNLFIEGKFQEAEAAKKQADSTYKTNYWQPQLLYIEAVYHIRQREDSIAKNSLQTLIAQDPKSPMAEKAQTMIDVLNRRSEIEAELSRYQIQHVEDTTTKNAVVQNRVVQNNLPVRKDTASNKLVSINTPLKNDTLANKPLVSAPPVTKTDTVTAKKEVVTTPPVKKDTTVTKPVVTNPPVKKDTVVAKKPVRKPGEYYFDSTTTHYAVVILDKVDPLFAVEVKNAYFRFNREHYRNQSFEMNIIDLDPSKKLLLIGNFATAREALDYMQAARRSAASEVMPWLKADKYSFSIITDENLQLLNQKKDLEQYRKFLDQNLPGKL
jgi:outer membrane protein assembly factor BamD (BamD/ComL family)